MSDCLDAAVSDDARVGVLSNIEHDREAVRRELVEQLAGDLARPLDEPPAGPDGFGPLGKVDVVGTPLCFAAEGLPVSVINHVVTSVVVDGVDDGETVLDGNQELIDFANALEQVCIETVESGKMTRT